MSLPTIRSTMAKVFTAVDEKSISSIGKVQVSLMLWALAGHFRLQNMHAFIKSWKLSTTAPGSAYHGKIVLGTSFLVHSELYVTALSRGNIQRLCKIDYGDSLKNRSIPETEQTAARILTKESAEPEDLAPRLYFVLANIIYRSSTATVSLEKTSLLEWRKKKSYNIPFTTCSGEPMTTLPEKGNPSLVTWVESFKTVFESHLQQIRP